MSKKSTLSPEQLHTLKELEKVTENLSKPLPEEKEETQEQEVSTDTPIPSKFIQIIVEDGLPQISYNGMNVTEVLGALKLSEALIIEKRINKEIKKQTYRALIEYDLVN